MCGSWGLYHSIGQLGQGAYLLQSEVSWTCLWSLFDSGKESRKSHLLWFPPLYWMSWSKVHSSAKKGWDNHFTAFKVPVCFTNHSKRKALQAGTFLENLSIPDIDCPAFSFWSFVDPMELEGTDWFRSFTQVLMNDEAFLNTKDRSLCLSSLSGNQLLSAPQVLFTQGE